MLIQLHSFLSKMLMIASAGGNNLQNWEIYVKEKSNRCNKKMDQFKR